MLWKGHRFLRATASSQRAPGSAARAACPEGLFRHRGLCSFSERSKGGLQILQSAS